MPEPSSSVYTRLLMCDMTLEAIARVWFGVWLGCFVAAAAELPPDVMVDKHLLQAKMLSEEKDHKGALEAMDRVVALQKEHDLTLPDEFSYQYAQTAFSAGSMQAAIDSANRYLSVAGREGKYYREALELLVKAEGKLLEPAVSREGSVLAGEAAGNTGVGAASGGTSGNAGSAASGGSCLIPNFPNHDPKADIKIPWCPSGGPQALFATLAAVYQCSLSLLDDPEKIRELRRRIADVCKRLADIKRGLGGDYHCQCPPGFGQ